MREVLGQAMATTGALFALLIAATTLTLVLRMLGTDRLVADWVTALPGGDLAVTAIVLGAIGLSAFVLDAFEIIFVIVPIVIPPLLIRVADARWVAVLVLLTLQTSFLLPPFGYALMMVRGTLRYRARSARWCARCSRFCWRNGWCWRPCCCSRSLRISAKTPPTAPAVRSAGLDRRDQPPHAGHADADPRSRTAEVTDRETSWGRQ